MRGLLLDGRRKSMQPMAERLGVDHQGLQQFVSSSTWAVEPVRRRLARRAVTVIDPEAWVVRVRPDVSGRVRPDVSVSGGPDHGIGVPPVVSEARSLSR